MTTIPSTPKALSPSLLPERETHYVLQSVYERVELDHFLSELVLVWNGGYLSFTADADWDTIDAQYLEGEFVPTADYSLAGPGSPLSRYVGKKCGWTWIAINQQGYRDSVLISFEDLIPNVMLHVIGSSIKVFTIAQK